MEALIDTLKKDALCSICDGMLTDPKRLQCLHSFCKNCLVDHVQLDKRNRFRCPTCKGRTQLQNRNNFDSLPSSKFHTRSIEVLSLTAGDSSGLSCDDKKCEEGKPVVDHCFDCHRFYCEKCSKSHASDLPNHRCADVTKLEVEDYKKLIRRPEFCPNPRHVKELLTFYCDTCEACACELCVVKHKGHNVEDLEERAEQEKAHLKKQLEKLNLLGQEAEKKNKELDELKVRVEAAAAEAKARTDREADAMIARVQAHRNEMLRQIDERTSAAYRPPAEE